MLKLNIWLSAELPSTSIECILWTLLLAWTVKFLKWQPGTKHSDKWTLSLVVNTRSSSGGWLRMGSVLVTFSLSFSVCKMERQYYFLHPPRALPSPIWRTGLSFFHPLPDNVKKKSQRIRARLVFSSVQIQRHHWKGWQLCFEMSLVAAYIVKKAAPCFPLVSKLIFFFSTPVQQHKSGLHLDCCSVCYLVDLNPLSSSVTHILCLNSVYL